ncbi:hypothetical protein M569_14647, partial [Genlisea aurea]
SSIPCRSNPNDSRSDGTGDFECNICFELAQDPVITLCGHLYCWPCLYRWLRIHSVSHECPVCKARIDEEKLVPLYGRGNKAPTDPRSRPVPGVEIPHRPAGQRPETAPPPPQRHSFGEDGSFSSSNLVFGLVGGFIPLALASFGVSAGFGGAFSPLFVHFNGFP